MRKEIKLFMSGIVFLMLTSPLLAQTLLVSNGGFENGLTSWITQAGGTSRATFSSETADAIEGTKSLKCIVTTLGANSWDLQFMNSIKLQEGVSYRASVWAKGLTASLKMNFAVGKSSSGFTEYGKISSTTLTTSWKEYSFTFTSPVTTTYDARVVFNLSSTGTYLFDNFVLVETVVNKADVSTNGKIIDIEMITNIFNPSQELDLTFFVQSKTNGYKKVNAMMWKPSTMNTVRVTLTDTVFMNEEVTVSYYPGTIYKYTGNEITGFSVVPANGSTIKQPVVASVKDEYIDNIRLFPIPYTNMLNVQLSNTCSGIIEISDLAGRVVLKQVHGGQTTVSINTSELNQGLYIIKVYDGSGNIQSVKKAIKN